MLPKQILLSMDICGKVLFSLRLVDSHSGNMSFRHGEYLWITRTGTNLSTLHPGDWVCVPLKKPHPNEKKGSRETIVHKGIYKEHPSFFFLLHAHSPYTVLLAGKTDLIIPEDSEGKELLGKIPVVNAEKPSGSEEVAEKVREAFRYGNPVVVRTHGVFSAGKTADEALFRLCALENSSFYLWKNLFQNG